MNPRLVRLAKLAALVALAYVLKLPFLSIPNVEFFTYLCFVAGYLFGIWSGALTAAVAMTLYSLFNPYGPAGPVLTVAKVLATIVVGTAGGVAFRLKFVPRSTLPSLIVTALLGLVLTLQFDLITNLAIVATTGQFWPIMVGAIPFAAVHIVSNTVIFVVFNPLLFRLARLEHRL